MKLLIVACALTLGSAVMAAEYFVAPGGKPGNPGTLKAPWDLAQANAAVDSALAGAMSLGQNSMLGVAMGSSQAAGTAAACSRPCRARR